MKRILEHYSVPDQSFLGALHVQNDEQAAAPAHLNALSREGGVVVVTRYVDSFANECPDEWVDQFIHASEVVFVNEQGAWGFRQQDYPYPLLEGSVCG